MIVRLFLPLAVYFILCFPGHSLAQESMSMSQAQAVADAVTRWDGQNPGDLFKAVKKANPDMGAITSLRELNKRMSGLPPEIRQAVVSNQNKAQGMIQQRIRDIRKGYRMTPQQARAAYGYGDIGSWNLTGRDKLPTAEMDVDSTVFGSDPAVTKEVRDGLSAELLRGLTDGSPESLDLQKDFDIVLTAEGHEGASHVYETQGGKDWAKRNMRSVTIVNPDGTQRTYELGKGGDPIFELAMAQNMAELRTAATRGGEYDLLFDASGNLRPQNEIPREVWNKYTKQLKAVDYYISRSDTATGGILEMARHQKQEVIGKNFEPTSAVKKNLKFAARADNIARGARISEKLISADPILGDSANAELVQFARQLTAAKSDQAVAELVKNRFGGEPSQGQVGALSNQVAKVILRYSEVAFQSEMDRIVLEINTKEGRKTALDRLANHFMLIAGEGGEYTDMAASALEAIDKVKQVNDGDGIDALRQNWNSMEKIRQMDDTVVNRTKNYLNQTELGKKILDKYGKMMEYANKPIFGTGKPYHTSPMLVVIEGAVEATRTRMITMVQYMGSAAMWCAVVDDVRTGTDAEVAVKLGETLAMNTYYGMIASSLYAGIVQGDAKALARAIMYMIVPETALPALVEAIGKTTISLGAQILFEHQLEAQYILTAFNEQGQVKQIDDLPGREKAARALIDELLTPGGYKLAIGMFEKAIEVMKEKKYPQLVIDEFRGTEAIGKTAMVKAIESTVISGNHLILRDDGQLAAACLSIKKYNDEIAVLGNALKLEVPETQGPDWVEGFDLGRGEKAALQKLMTARGAAQEKAKDALAAGIIRTFEERYRAEQELAKGKDEALALLSQLEKILEQLQVHKDGMLALEREGTYNTIMGWFTANREKQLKAMQAVLRWRDTYLFVLEARTRAEEMAKMNIGQDYVPERRPLTGPYAPVTAPTISTDMLKAGPPLPALVGPILLNTGADSNNAQKYLKDVAEIGSSVTKDLEAIKGGKLEDGYDRDMYKKIYRVRFEKAYWDLMFEVSNQARGMIGTVQLWREAQRNSQREEAFNKGQALFKEDEGLKEEFRQYYALVKPTVAIAGAKETKLNSPVDLSATVTFPAGKREPKYEIRWTIETQGKALGSGKTTSFGAGEEGSVTIRAGVWADVNGKPQEVAWATHPIQVKKEDKKDDKKDGVAVAPVAPGTDKADPGKTGAKYVPACSYTYSVWGECSQGDEKADPDGDRERARRGASKRASPRWSRAARRRRPRKTRETSISTACAAVRAGGPVTSASGTTPRASPYRNARATDPASGGQARGAVRAGTSSCGPNDCAKGCWESAFGKGTYDPDKADKLRKDENKKYKKPLKVEIKASKNPADFGDIVELTAETSEGSGGYRWTWGGCAQDAKDSRAKVLNSRECKPCTASVTATDQDGDSASASLEVKCTALKVKLTQETPKETTIPIGSKATFLAEVFSGDKPASGSFSYIWERNPDALFGDPKNPTYETKGGSQSRNTATFKKMGTTPVWVSVLKEVDGRKMTVGESEQIPIQAVSPKLKLSINKKEPLIGEKVVITVHEEPAMSNDIITFWWEIKGDAANPGPEPNIPNQRSYSFKPKNVKPVTVTVHAKAKEDGSDLGQADVTVNPKGYAVTIGEPRYLGPKPKIWKCETQLGGACPGLVDVGDQQFAVHHDVFMKATVTPALSGARYRWAIDPAGSCGMPGAGDEIKMNCSETGTYTASLKVANSDGDQVGEASRSVTISVSQKDMDGSKKAKEAQEKLQKAKGLVAEGKLDEGIALASEAAGLDPKNAEAKSLAQKWGNEKQTVTQQLDKTKKLITENQFDQAEKEFAPAQKLHPKYPPVVETDKLLKTKKDEYKKNVAGKLADAKTKARKGDYDGAIKDAEDAAKFDPSNKEAAGNGQKLRQEKETIHQQIDKAKKLMDENKFADAQKELIVASNLNGYYPPVPAANKELGDSLEQVQRRGARQGLRGPLGQREEGLRQGPGDRRGLAGLDEARPLRREGAQAAGGLGEAVEGPEGQADRDPEGRRRKGEGIRLRRRPEAIRRRLCQRAEHLQRLGARVQGGRGASRPGLHEEQAPQRADPLGAQGRRGQGVHDGRCAAEHPEDGRRGHRPAAQQRAAEEVARADRGAGGENEGGQRAHCARAEVSRRRPKRGEHLSFAGILRPVQIRPVGREC